MDATGFTFEELSEPYYFETDHVALKENVDYRQLLRSIALLEAQRQQAAKDIDVLYKAQNDALENPLSFVENLQKGVGLSLPKPQKIAELPDIQWEKYSLNTNFTSFGSSSQHMTRNKKTSNEGADNDVRLKSNLVHGLVTPSNSLTNSVGPNRSETDIVVVRGRAKDKSKSATFNQLWTSEEQQRLEHLLVQYPGEEVESKRWAKIAEALGNRTPIQVASRVQKYFLRLAKEGLPIPGRTPNLSTYSKKGSHRHHRYNRIYNVSTFMQTHTPPVWMKDEDDDQGFSLHTSYAINRPANGSEDNTPAMSETASIKDDSSDEDNLPEELINTPEYQELQRLKRLKRQMLSQQRNSATKHIGYKCDKCGCEPIIGTRWHCIDCPADLSFDFCEECSDTSFQKDNHNSSHRLHPYMHAVLDSDYMSNTTMDYNYLDPNYMPAS